MDRRIIDGATLFGTSLTIFALRTISGKVNWQYWLLLFASVVFFLLSLRAFFGKPIK